MAVSDAAAVKALTARQLHFVSGKGGVGKSVVACALARRFTDEGHDTLLCQVNARDSHSALLGIRGPGGASAIGDEVAQVGPHLWAVNMTPQAALHEYARMILKFDGVVRAVFENRLARAFLRFVPALPELNMLGKVWFHATEEDDGRPRFARIVVDAPSTGHGLSFLGVARALYELSRGRGPMAEKTAQMQAVLTDPTRTALHVVTLPEELPTNEALEFIARARSQKTAPLGLLVVNMVTGRLLSDPAAAAVQGLSPAPGDEVGEAITEVLKRRLAREELEALHVARTDPASTGLPRAVVPFVSSTRFGPEEVARVAEALS